MNNALDTPFFSVIIPTRDRPELFARALESALRQTCSATEIVVVNDGSGEASLEAYTTIEALNDPRIRRVDLRRRERGHGPSYAINSGAELAQGTYLCFLDDDDEWIDDQHLENVQGWITDSQNTVDALYTNQHAFDANGHQVKLSLWLNGLADTYTGRPGAHSISAGALLAAGSFPHLNCTILRRELFDSIGGFDDGIRYECEVDLYLRTLDAAALLLYSPAFIARHNVPAGADRSSESTQLDATRKRLSQAHVYTKNHLLANNPLIQDEARRRLAGVYRRLSWGFTEDGDAARAHDYARQAQAVRPTLRWGVKTLLLAASARLRDS